MKTNLRWIFLTFAILICTNSFFEDSSHADESSHSICIDIYNTDNSHEQLSQNVRDWIIFAEGLRNTLLVAARDNQKDLTDNLTKILHDVLTQQPESLRGKLPKQMSFQARIAILPIEICQAIRQSQKEKSQFAANQYTKNDYFFELNQNDSIHFNFRQDVKQRQIKKSSNPVSSSQVFKLQEATHDEKLENAAQLAGLNLNIIQDYDPALSQTTTQLSGDIVLSLKPDFTVPFEQSIKITDQIRLNIHNLFFEHRNKKQKHLVHLELKNVNLKLLHEHDNESHLSSVQLHLDPNLRIDTYFTDNSIVYYNSYDNQISITQTLGNGLDSLMAYAVPDFCEAQKQDSSLYSICNSNFQVNIPINHIVAELSAFQFINRDNQQTWSMPLIGLRSANAKLNEEGGIYVLLRAYTLEESRKNRKAWLSLPASNLPFVGEIAQSSLSHVTQNLQSLTIGGLVASQYFASKLKNALIEYQRCKDKASKFNGDELRKEEQLSECLIQNNLLKKVNSQSSEQEPDQQLLQQRLLGTTHLSSPALLIKPTFSGND